MGADKTHNRDIDISSSNTGLSACMQHLLATSKTRRMTSDSHLSSIVLATYFMLAV